MKKILAIPVLLLVGFIVAYNAYSEYRANKMLEKYDQIFYESFHRYPDKVTASSRGDSVDMSGLSEVMANYNNSNYEKALSDFDNYLTDNPGDYRIKFYRGVTKLHLENTEDAIKDLKEVADLKQDFEGQAEWYLALAYIKSDQVDKAVPLLDAIVARDNEHSSMSKTVLDQVNS